MKPSTNGNGRAAHSPERNGSSPEPEPVSDESYKEQINVIKEHSGGNFALLHWHHLRYLNGDGSATIILCYLLNLLRMKDASSADRDKLKEDGMWFKTPMNNILRDTAMGYEKVRRCLATLQDKDIVATSHRQGNYLWVKIDADTLKLISDNDEAMQEKRDKAARLGKTPSQGRLGEKPDRTWGKTRSDLVKPQVRKQDLNPIDNKDLGTVLPDRKNTTKNHSKELLAEPGGEPGKSLRPEGFYYWCTEELIKAMKRKKIVEEGTYKNVAGLTKHVRGLVEEDGASINEVEQVANWYKVNLKRDKWVPVIFKLEQFRTRFPNIKDAYYRDKANKETDGNPDDAIPRSSRLIATVYANGDGE